MDGVSGTSRSAPRSALVLGSTVPLLVLVAAPFVAGAFPEGARQRILAGIVIGAACAWLIGLAFGVWTLVACRRGGGRFLAPMVFGFLTKLLVLGAGMWVVHWTLADWVDPVAYALGFASAAFGWQLVFALRVGRPARSTADPVATKASNSPRSL